MGCTDQDKYKDLFSDMAWYISKSSGLIQLNPLLSLDVVYKMGHGSGTTGKMWDEHHSELASFIHKYNPKNILEIGGSHGILANKYLESYSTQWTIIDPNPRIPKSLQIQVIERFFDDTFVSKEVYDTIVHSHVLEHIYDPNIFLKHIASSMRNNSLMVFSIPNMLPMFKKMYTNCINFEHTIFLTEPYIDFLMAKYNFELVEKSYFRDDHSIFYCVRKKGNVDSVTLPENLYTKNKELYLKYVKYNKELICKLNSNIQITTDPIYLFGAHVFSQFLIATGLNVGRVAAILDNDHLKQGKRLYGSNLRVESPEILRDLDNPVVILRMGIYNAEIKQDIFHNINSTTKFLE